ncbi:MAG: fibronectin type III domain-containing protein [bacterium]|nr:fibronectin type III domain-containing protein [bacterium]
MKNILKNRPAINLILIITSSLMSLAFYSTSYAAAITTYNASSISPTSAILDCIVDVTSSAATVWFEYGQNGSLGNFTPKSTIGINLTTQSCSYKGGFSTYYISNLTPNTSYSFRALSQDTSTAEIVYGETLTFSTPTAQKYTTNSAPGATTNPAYGADLTSVSLDATIKPNGSFTTAWFEYGTSYGLGNTVSSKTFDIREDQSNFNYRLLNLAPNTFYYFRVVAQNNNGITYGTIYSFITSNNSNGGANLNKPVVTTVSPLLVRENYALLNGNVIINNSVTTAWFEWSEDANVSINAVRSAGQTINQGNGEVYFAASLTNLILGKTYYFRAVAQNAYGISYGNIKQFTTQTPTPVATAPTNTVSDNTTVSVPKTAQTAITKNNLSLEAEFDNNNPRPGKEVIYALSYKNISDFVLKNAALNIILPNEVSYMNSSFANVGVNNNALNFKLGDIAIKDSGSVSIKVKITELAKIETLNFDSSIAYSNNGKSGKENLISELKLNSSFLAASSMDTLGNIFSNAFVDLILGGLIGAWIYHFTAKKKEVIDETDPLK